MKNIRVNGYTVLYTYYINAKNTCIQNKYNIRGSYSFVHVIVEKRKKLIFIE